ncbi:head maturation protease, ClpP-related [Dietzia maris]
MARPSGWFKVNALDEQKAELLMFGEIGWEVVASDIASRLGEIDASELTVRINSPGGDAFEGLAIMNALRHHPAHVTVIVEGLAASAASVIAVGGGDRVVMRPGSELMVHNAWQFTAGGAEDLVKAADNLSRLSGTIAEIYAEKSGTDVEQWKTAMSAETWFSADEAVQAGLADAVEDAREGKKALAGAFNLAGFKHAGRASAPAPKFSVATRAPMEEENMTFLNEVARKLGVQTKADETTILAALDQVLAEQVAEVTVTTMVTYPEEVEVVPTGKASVAPTGVVPEGLVFTIGEVPDGWAAEVNETTGELTVTAPDGGVVGDTAVIGLSVAGGEGEPSPLTVAATIISASADQTGDPAPATPGGEETVTLDRGVYDSLLARAAQGDSAQAAEAGRRAEALVNAAIRDGKVLAARKDALVARAREDYQGMERLFASLASGTIPVSEKGRGGSDDEHSDETAEQRKARLAQARNSLGIR